MQKNIAPNINFTSNYKFQRDKNNMDRVSNVTDELFEPEIYDEDYKKHSTFTKGEEIKNGVFEHIAISAPDEYDDMIESLLRQNGIDFKKQSKKESLTPENIYNRIILPDSKPNLRLVPLDVDKVQKLFEKDKGYLDSRKDDFSFQSVRKWLEYGFDIYATDVNLSDDDGELRLAINDGRHRFCIMRDLGMKKIKFALNEDSYKLAQKYGLIAN